MTLILITNTVQVWKQPQSLNLLLLVEAAEGCGFWPRAFWVHDGQASGFMMFPPEALLVFEDLVPLFSLAWPKQFLS